MAKIHEPVVKSWMDEIQIAADKHIGELLLHFGHFTNDVSARTNAGKILNALAETNQLVKGPGYFKTPDCQSQFKEHAQLITNLLVQIKKLTVESVIVREHFIEPVSLRPDAIVLLIRDNQGCCFVLEVLNHEGEQSVEKKRNVWKHWPERTTYLSHLFNRPIPHVDFVTSEQLPLYIKEII